MAQPFRHHIEITPRNIGNHLFAYLFAQRLKKALAGEVGVAFRGIPDLAMPAETCSQLEPAEKKVIEVRHHTPDLQELINLSKAHSLNIKVMAPVCNLSLIPTVEACRPLVPGSSAAKALAEDIVSSAGTKLLWVHVRAGNILEPVHRDYSPTPVAYIKEAQQLTGKHIAFFGQTAGSWYMDHLRDSFPEAIIIPAQSPSVDFEILRHAKYITLSASTFAWIGAWLSTQSRLILMPKHGFFDPERRPDIGLINELDARYVQLSSSVPEREWYPPADGRTVHGC